MYYIEMEIRSLALEDLRVRMAILPQQRRRVLLGYFLSIIPRNNMGYTVAMSQIMSFPPYVLVALGWQTGIVREG